jgi:hypothetical protein
MDVIGWLWWLLSTVVGAALTLVWFLVSGWVSALLQIALLIVAVFFLKYGWQRAPAEIWRRSRSFGRISMGWLRAGEPDAAGQQPGPAVRIVKVKEFGDVNISTLLSLLSLFGLVLAIRL